VQAGPAPAETELRARVRQCQVAHRAAPGLWARVQPAARRKAVPAVADRHAAGYPARERSGLVRAGPGPPGRAGGARLAQAATELLRAVVQHPAAGFRRARWQAGRAEVARHRQELPDPAQGVAVLPVKARWPAADRERSAGRPDGAERCRRRRWAGSAGEPAGGTKAVARSGLEPDAVACSARPRVGAARLAERAERVGRAQEPVAAPDVAAARARRGWPVALPAAEPEDGARSGPLQPDVPARPGEQPAAGRVREVGPARGGRRERGAPGRQGAAGGADPAGRHRPTGPGRAGAMERRNCPATA
jgi:hypothetical protein